MIVHAPRPSWLEPDVGWVMFHPKSGVLIVPTTPLGRSRIAAFTGPEETRDWLVADAAEMRERLAERCAALAERDDALAEYERRRKPANARALRNAHRLHRMRTERSRYRAAILGARVMTRVPALSARALRRPG